VLVKAKSSVSSSSDTVGIGDGCDIFVSFSVGMGVFWVWIDITLIFFLVGDGVICNVGDRVVISFRLVFELDFLFLVLDFLFLDLHLGLPSSVHTFV